MTFLSRWGFAATILLLSSAASAAETDDDAKRQPSTRLEITPTSGLLIEHRAGDKNDGALGWSFGGEARLQRGMHGFLLAYTGVATEMTTVGLGHGPATHYIDAAYSLRLGDSRSLGEPIGFALGFDIGPTLAFVERTLTSSTLDPNTNVVDVPGHGVFGGRASVALRLNLYRLVLGLDVGYRGGVPIDVYGPKWEGALFTQLALGMAFDLPTRPKR